MLLCQQYSSIPRCYHHLQQERKCTCRTTSVLRFFVNLIKQLITLGSANWREPYQCYQCDYNFFCKPTDDMLLRNHTECISSYFGAQLIEKVQCFLWFSQRSFALGELIHCAFPNIQYFLTFYQRVCTGFHICFYPRAFSNHLLC